MNIIKGIDLVTSFNLIPNVIHHFARINVPTNLRACISHFSNYVGTQSTWGRVIWSLTVNRIIIPEYSNIRDQMGTQINPRKLIVDIDLSGGDVFEVMIQNIGTITTPVGVVVQGFFYK